jgi:isopenicillin-N N-acyltransferase-like protein
MVHNEDYDVQEEDFAVLVKASPDDAPSFMAMAYGGIWFNAGVNECGIGLAGTGLAHTDSRVGIPGDCSFRKVLSARTIGDAIAFSTPRGRSFSYCNIICHESGEMYAMEGSATDFAAIHGRKFLAHANHYVHPSMVKYDAAFISDEDRSPDFYSDSIFRHNRATNLALDKMPIDVEGIMEITRDHVNRPWSLCRHIDETLPPEKRSKTVFSEIIDVTDRTILVCKGNPCEGDYELHKL